jgi:hypothetical protein
VGFTLVEVVMAALVLSAGILLVLGAEQNARQLGARGARRLRAVESVASSLDAARAGCVVGVPALVVPASASAAVDGRTVQAATLLACAGP